MIVEQIFCHNSLRNFNYIIACEKTREAVVIDPLRTDLILDLVYKKKYNIKFIINTHEHSDHTEGNLELMNKTKAIVYCHYKAIGSIPGATQGLKNGDVLKLGESIRIKILDTPGHTMSHICLLIDHDESNMFSIFSGDTLFNAGVGRCFSGDVNILYTTFSEIMSQLPDHTLVYPGHDYLEKNLRFTLSIEPNNLEAKQLLSLCINKKDKNNNFIVTSIKTEKQINLFLRLGYQNIIDYFNNNFNDKDIFIALRGLRDQW